MQVRAEAVKRQLTPSDGTEDLSKVQQVVLRWGPYFENFKITD